MRRPSPSFALAGAALLALGCSRPRGNGADASAASTDASTGATTVRLSGCALRFASEPARERGVAWGPCVGDAVAGCREALVLGATAASYTPGGTIALVGVARAPGAEYVLGPPDGPPRVVVDTDCDVRYRAVGDDDAALGVERAFFVGPLANDPRWRTPAATLAGDLADAVLDPRVAVSRGALHAVDRERRLVLSTAPNAASFKAARTGFTESGPLGVVVAGPGAAVFFSRTTPESFGLQLEGGSPVAWYAAPDGDAFGEPARDGAWLVWLRGRDRTRGKSFRTVDVLATPFPSSPAAPVVTRLGGTSTHTLAAAIAGGGHVAYLDGDEGHTSALVLDATSHSERRFTPPRGRTVTALLWVNEHELAIEIGTAGDGGARVAERTAWRLPLSSLANVTEAR